jgi:hypothetical protein
MRTANILSTIVLFAAIAPCIAQELNEDRKVAPQMTQLLAAMCPQFTSQIIGRPELAAVLKDRPINTAAVCTCTDASFKADKRLQKQFDLEPAVLAERMKSEHLRAYFILRLSHSVLSCLLPEMAETLDKSNPAE